MSAGDQFREALGRRFRRALRYGLSEVEITSGDLHREVGGYPGRDHRMPVCCDVMYAMMREGDWMLGRGLINAQP